MSHSLRHQLFPPSQSSLALHLLGKALASGLVAVGRLSLPILTLVVAFFADAIAFAGLVIQRVLGNGIKVPAFFATCHGMVTSLEYFYFQALADAEKQL
jgi:hypothetical protein